MLDPSLRSSRGVTAVLDEATGRREVESSHISDCHPFRRKEFHLRKRKYRFRTCASLRRLSLLWADGLSRSWHLLGATCNNRHWLHSRSTRSPTQAQHTQAHSSLHVGQKWWCVKTVAIAAPIWRSRVVHDRPRVWSRTQVECFAVLGRSGRI